MVAPNKFNESFSGSGDHIILPANPEWGFYIHQTNIQNKSGLSTEIELFAGSDLIWGPITLPANGFLSFELVGSSEPIFNISSGNEFKLNSSANVDLQVFGHVETN